MADFLEAAGSSVGRAPHSSRVLIERLTFHHPLAQMGMIGNDSFKGIQRGRQRPEPPSPSCPGP